MSRHELSPYDSLSGPEWAIATQKLVVESLRRSVRTCSDETSRKHLVTDLANQEQELAAMLNPPTPVGEIGEVAKAG